MYWSGGDSHLDPPDPINWAECHLCHTRYSVGDMVCLDEFNEVYVCKWCVRDNPEEYSKLLDECGGNEDD